MLQHASQHQQILDKSHHQELLAARTQEREKLRALNMTLIEKLKKNVMFQILMIQTHLVKGLMMMSQMAIS